MTARHIALLSCVALATALLAGCGGGDPAASAPAGQAIARVNGQELTVHQLQAEAASQPQPTDPAAAQKVKEAAALALLDRALLVQAASIDGLEREPAVVQQVARSREQVLASAYLQRVMAEAGTPTESELKAYYDAHPELFAQRRGYVLAQVVTDGTVPRAELDAQGRQLATPADLVKWLRQRGAPAQLRTVTLAAEQMPTAVLARLSELKPGQALVASIGDAVQVNYLLDTRPAPVLFTDTRPAIEQLLTVQRRQEAAQRELERLRAAAQLTWLGEFAKTPPQRVEAASPSAPPAAAGANAAADVAPAAHEQRPSDSADPAVPVPADAPAASTP